ncbi:MAG TPA: hypothetical protein ENN33_14100, partial [Ignavibacteria bacterium]|nr:hypothetical protein [Ignavibacteria bacterium]
MKTKPKLYLHAGCGKTGTTAIQGFLYDNRNILLNKGFLYPKTGLVEDGSHHQLATILCDIDMRNTNKFKIISKESILEELAQEIKEHESVLISSELFAQQWSKLSDFFINMWSEIYVIFYIRDRCDLAESLYNQWVKESIETCPYIDEIHDIPKYYNYTDFLKGYSRLFGTDHIIVKRYGSLYFKNGSIYDDFLSILGILSISDFKIPDKKENIKLSLESLEIIRLINSLNISKKTRERLKYYAKIFTTQPTYSFNLISENLRNEIDEYFAEEDEFILNNFFASNVCLFEKSKIEENSGRESLNKHIYSSYIDFLYAKDKNTILE